MTKDVNKIRIQVFLILYILLWVILNAFILTSYPFVHSDETWLAGITRTMLDEGSIAVTAPFFDLQPRTVHGLRLIFQGVQSLFQGILGYSVVGFRALSLFAGGLSLFLFFFLLKRLGFLSRYAFLGVVLLSLDIQFLYASHFGRQEILLFVFMLGGLTVAVGPRGREGAEIKKSPELPRGIAAGCITGLALGVHPNAFVVAWPVALLILFLYFQGRRSLKELLLFFSTAALSAGVFITLSFLLNENFFKEYLSYGVSVGVRTGFLERFTDFLPFFTKLFHRISGTYYLPDIRAQLLLLPFLTLAGAVWLLLRGEKERRPKVPGRGSLYDVQEFGITRGMLVGVTGVLGITGGLIVLGKYSQLSILFYFPFLYLLLLCFLSRFTRIFQRRGKGDEGVKEHPKRFLRAFSVFLPLLLVIISFVGSVTQVNRVVKREKGEFQEYILRLRAAVPAGAKVLMNLNGGTAFPPEDFLDWRNLRYLESAGMTAAEYVRSRGIDYIVYPEELDYIYETRPVWNMMYGNIYPWYEDLHTFLSSSCDLEEVFSSPGYAMRITALRYSRNWEIRVYRVLDGP